MSGANLTLRSASIAALPTAAACSHGSVSRNKLLVSAALQHSRHWVGELCCKDQHVTQKPLLAGSSGVTVAGILISCS